MSVFKTTWRLMEQKERQWFLFFALVIFISLGGLFFLYLAESTEKVPAAGGAYTLGVVGQPIHINPVVASSEADRHLLYLLFTPLGQLTQKIEANTDHKVWTVRLKEGLVWQDGSPLTIDDLVFTVQKIQEAQGRSLLSPSLEGATIERVSELEARFVLSSPYVFFGETLEQLFLVPKKPFERIPLSNWPLSEYNLKPIGNGPFLFSSSEVQGNGFVSKMEFAPNPYYLEPGRPYVSRFTVRFYTSTAEALAALNSGFIDGLGGLTPGDITSIKRPLQTVSFSLPGHYAIFMNTSQNTALQERAVREALHLALDRNDLVKTIFAGQGHPLSTAFEEFGGTSGTDLPRAQTLLETAGWQEINGKRSKVSGKTTQPLEIQLTFPDLPFLQKTAEFLKTSWEKLGVTVTLQKKPLLEISRETIPHRDYELLLFGNILNPAKDYFSFWHSSEALHPGLNLSLLNNKGIDSLLVALRQESDEAVRLELFKKLETAMEQEARIIFLYQLDSTLATAKNLGGVRPLLISDPAGHLKEVASWHVKTKRAFKSGSETPAPKTPLTTEASL